MFPYYIIHTQVFVNEAGTICHFQSGFLEHQNDVQLFGIMHQR